MRNLCIFWTHVIYQKYYKYFPSFWDLFKHFFFFLLFIYLFIFILLYNTVLVSPYIDMNPPWVYVSSQSWTPLPPLSPYHPSGSPQCTSPKHSVSCIEPGLAIHFTYDMIHVLMPFPKSMDDFGAKENKVCHCFHCSPSICHEVMGSDAMILVFWMLSFKPTFSLSSFTFIPRLFSSSSLSAIRVASSAYLRLLIFLLAILIPGCSGLVHWDNPEGWGGRGVQDGEHMYTHGGSMSMYGKTTTILQSK